MELRPVTGDTGAAARMLIASDYLSTPEEVVEFILAPHKWVNEVELWSGAGRPLPTEPGWELFLARIEKLESIPPQ